MRNNSFGAFAVTTAVVATAACCILLLPGVRAFISTPTRTRQNLKLSAEPSTDNDRCERQSNGMPILPSDVVKYTQVPKTSFTATTIPSGLKKQHTTKKGTWGIIRVSKGRLEYSIVEPQESLHVLDKDRLGVIEPQMLHQVRALSDDLEFVVEFWRAPGTGAVDEKREGLN